MQVQLVSDGRDQFSSSSTLTAFTLGPSDPNSGIQMFRNITKSPPSRLPGLGQQLRHSSMDDSISVEIGGKGWGVLIIADLDVHYEMIEVLLAAAQSL